MSPTNIHPTAILGRHSEIGEGSTIGPYCIVNDGVTLGRNSRLHSHVVVDSGVEIGEENEVFPFATIGSPPQSKSYDGSKTFVKIGSNNIIREHVSIHAGTVTNGGTTSIGSRNFLMVGAHIAHDCILGNDITMANNVLLGGHVQIDDKANLGGGALIQQFCRIGKGAMVGGGTALPTDLIPYGMAFGNHGTLRGLNLVGIKRAGASRTDLQTLRQFYNELFATGDGEFRDRLESAREQYSGHILVDEILAFLDVKGKQPLTFPQRS